MRQPFKAGFVADPFYVFLDLVHAFGEGQVFLLDAGQDAASPHYKMSILGVCPAMEICVKDGFVTIFSEQGLDKYIQDVLVSRGHRHLHNREGAAYRSVVDGNPLYFHADDPMGLLEDIRIAIRELGVEASLVPFSEGLIGYIGYDAVHYLETLPKTTDDDRQLPDIRLQWHAATIHIVDGEVSVFEAASLDRVLAEHTKASLRNRLDTLRDVLNTAVEANVRPEWWTALDIDSDETSIFHEDVPQATYEENVRRAKEYIASGDIFQVVLSKRIRMKKSIHHYVAYERLRKVNPSPYMFVAEYPDMRLFGASPEVQFRSVDGFAEMKPIAGTSKGRGRTLEEDLELRNRLLADEKERSEHVMLVDLCRNDLGRVCSVGTVQVTDFMVVEPYSHLFHLVSAVSGKPRSDVSVFHALLTTFPAGTLSGAPKIRAMEIIDELETYRRGPYGGLIGMIDVNANANTAIIIRTVVEHRDEYFIQVGAGVVADSNPTMEWQECGHKAGAVFDVLTGRRLQNA